MKVFIDYDKQKEVYVATSEDGTLTASNASDMFVKLSFVKAAKVAGYSGHSSDYNFVLRTSRLSQEGDRPIDLDEFWGSTNNAKIKRRDKILRLAEEGVSIIDIASEFDLPSKYIQQMIDNQD